MRRDHHRLRRVAQRLRQVLQADQRLLDAFEPGHQRRRIEVGADREALAIVADDQRRVSVIREQVQRAPAGFDQPGGDAVLLGREFPEQGAITHIMHSAIAIAVELGARSAQVRCGDFARIRFQRQVVAIRRTVVTGDFACLVALIEGRASVSDHGLDPARHRIAIGFKAVDGLGHANRIPDLEWTQLMREAPLLRVVHIDDGIGDLGHAVGGVSQQEKRANATDIGRRGRQR